MTKETKLWSFILPITGVILFFTGVQSQHSTQAGLGLLCISIFFGVFGIAAPKSQGEAELVEQRHNPSNATGGSIFRHPDVKHWAWLKEQIKATAISAFWFVGITIVGLVLLNSF